MIIKTQLLFFISMYLSIHALEATSLRIFYRSPYFYGMNKVENNVGIFFLQPTECNSPPPSIPSSCICIFYGRGTNV